MRPTRVVVDLRKLHNNIRQIKTALSPSTELMAVVKADAYGHGAIRTAAQAVESGAAFLGVAIPEEGAELKKAGLQVPILVLGAIDDSQIDLVIDNNLIQTVASKDMVVKLNETALKKKKTAAVHVKVDTGMGRIGIRSKKELDEISQYLLKSEGLRWEGIYTHFSAADELDESFTHTQIQLFNEYLSTVRELNPTGLKWVHAANSAAIMQYPEAHFNMVRAGISIYGYYPSNEVTKETVQLEPVLSWMTRVVHVKEIAKGESVSYGRTFTADRPTRVATLPVGYADGFNRLLSNRGEVIIRGVRVPIIGRVCMDQIMVDVTEIPSASTGDEVVLIGEQGTAKVTADEMAGICGTISYEILTSIGQRVPRIYVGRENEDEGFNRVPR